MIKTYKNTFQNQAKLAFYQEMNSNYKMSVNQQSKSSRDFSSYLGRNYGSSVNNFDSLPKSKMFSINSNNNRQSFATNKKYSMEELQQEHSFDHNKSSFIDNFKFVSSKPHASYLKLQAQSRKKLTATQKSRDQIQKNAFNIGKNQEQAEIPAKSFYVNGVNYFKDFIPCDKKAEVLKDCYSLKGDYFYLKKGQIASIRYAIGEYVEVKFQSFFGYFPAMFFKLL